MQKSKKYQKIIKTTTPVIKPDLKYSLMSESNTAIVDPNSE